MKKFLIGMVGTALAGSLAFAQQETTQEEVSEYGEEIGQATEEWDQEDPMTQTDPEMEDPTQTETEDPMMGEESQSDESTWGEQSGMQESGMQQSVADMSAEELQGMTVVSESGEEIGEIDQVGQSDEYQDRVVTVDVGGFLGVAQKTIAIPVSELEVGSEGNIKTTLSKESIESREEFDAQGFTAEGETQTESTY